MKGWVCEFPGLTTHPVLMRVAEERKKNVIYPIQDKVFYALQLTSFKQVRVVILGQDPYHGAGQAHGLAFSVPEGIKPPPSLRNILKEVGRDVGQGKDSSTDLSRWAIQGVLLLNVVLTVEKGRARSHCHWGWEEVTDAIIIALNARRKNLIFLLWGNDAQSKIPLIDRERHHILTTSHPSSYSAYLGFSGCGHFSQSNKVLAQLGEKKICW